MGCLYWGQSGFCCRHRSCLEHPWYHSCFRSWSRRIVPRGTSWFFDGRFEIRCGVAGWRRVSSWCDLSRGGAPNYTSAWFRCCVRGAPLLFHKDINGLSRWWATDRLAIPSWVLEIQDRSPRLKTPRRRHLDFAAYSATGAPARLSVANSNLYAVPCSTWNILIGLGRGWWSYRSEVLGWG